MVLETIFSSICMIIWWKSDLYQSCYSFYTERAQKKKLQEENQLHV
jgi:hypothetical protein